VLALLAVLCSSCGRARPTGHGGSPRIRCRLSSPQHRRALGARSHERALLADAGDLRRTFPTVELSPLAVTVWIAGALTSRERVRQAMRRWAELYGRVPSSYDWSRTHAHRRGAQALRRLQRGEWPAPATAAATTPWRGRQGRV
jgi:hypothetical protein